jgi:hypothetical protein
MEDKFKVTLGDYVIFKDSHDSYFEGFVSMISLKGINVQKTTSDADVNETIFIKWCNIVRVDKYKKAPWVKEDYEYEDTKNDVTKNSIVGQEELALTFRFNDEHNLKQSELKIKNSILTRKDLHNLIDNSSEIMCSSNYSDKPFYIKK